MNRSDFHSDVHSYNKSLIVSRTDRFPIQIYLTALIFNDTLQNIEQSFVVALVTFSLLPGLSRKNGKIYFISFFITTNLFSVLRRRTVVHFLCENRRQYLIGWRTTRTQQQIIEASAALRLIYSSLILF